MGIAASPARLDRVWTLIQGEDGGLFRSDDGGSTWEKLTNDPRLIGRPHYLHTRGPRHAGP